MSNSESNDLSRRRVLKATSGTAASLALVGAASADQGGDGGDGDHGGGNCQYYSIAAAGQMHGGGEHGEGEHDDRVQELMCPDHPHASTGPGHTMHHVNAAMGACPYGTGLSESNGNSPDHAASGCTEADWPDCTDWPQQTIDLIKASREALTSPALNNPGALIAQGYIPYFDVATPGPVNDGVSHWLNPRYIGDEYYEPQPWRPDSIILDNKWWKPLGPMYVATKNGDPNWVDKEDEVMEVRDAWGYENNCGECFPYHPHDGVPGRFAWWYYRQVHESDYASGDPEDLTLPCYTAPMMHAWIYPTPHGPHGSTAGAPPREYRPGGPPNRPGYPTPAVPGEDELSLDVLPEAVQKAAMPERLERELEVIDDLPQGMLETTPVTDLERLMDERLGAVGDGLDSIGSIDGGFDDFGGYTTGL
jgi:hypothetical protein